MSIKIKPLLYIFFALLVVFALMGLILKQSILPAKQQKQFEELQYSQVNVIEDLNNEEEILYFTVTDEHELSAAVRELKQKINDTEYKHYTLAVRTTEELSDEVKQTWNGMQFELYEIMGQYHYTKLPIIAEQINGQDSDVKVHFEIDETYVYLTITDGEQALYRMLPLQSPELRMWG